MKTKRLVSRLALLIPIVFSLFSLSSCGEDDQKVHSYKLCEQLNEFIREIKSDGTLEEMENIWFGSDESKKVIDRNLSGENGTITFASCLSNQPMGYYKDGLEVGLSTDIIYRFAKANGYALEFYDSSNTNTSIAAVLSGKADFGGTYLSITEERKKNGCFSEPYYDNKVTVVTTLETAATIENLEELNGEIWGCCEGSTYMEYIREKMSNSQIREYFTETETLRELSQGKIKAVVLDKPVADYIVNNNFFPNLCEFSQFFDYEDQYSFFFPKFVEQTLDSYATKRIATVIGSIDEQFLKERLPEAELYYFDTLVDCCAALSQNKVDAYVDETASFIYAKDSNPLNLYRIPEAIGQAQYGFMFPKTDKGKNDCDDFNDFLASLKSSGKLDELIEKWLYHHETATSEIDYQTLQGDETLHVQTVGQYPPFSFVKGDKIDGLEVEIATLYAKSRNKKLHIELNSFTGILSSANRTDIDFAFTMLCYAPEREASFNFSDSYYDFDIFLVTYIGADNINFGEKISNSFKSTFVTEKRWQLILSGLLETLKITLISIAIGTILGFLIFLVINRSPFLKRFLKVFDYIINGMPVVVFLMIVYYVIFAKSTLSNSAIAIGAFSILFTSNVAKALSISVGGVNKNQMESALALGYRHPRALFRFVLPQALPSFLKLYKDDVINLLKSTAIVGYIAIQDLTKASDIIRSRTYEAVFPLVTLALIYFLLTYIFILVLKRIEVSTNPKRRKPSKILEGVDTHANRN